MATFQDIINNVDLDESHDEFYENETVVESVDADGMVAIIEGIENGKVTGNEADEESLETALEKDNETASNNTTPTNPVAPITPPTNSTPSTDTNNGQHNAQSTEQTATNNQQQPQQEQAQLGLFEQKFPKIAERIKIRFHNAPEDLEKLMKFLNKKNVVSKVTEALEKIGNEPVMVDNKAVGALVKY